MKRLNFNKKQLEELYLYKKLSLNQIAEIFDCCDTNILYWLKKFNIKRWPAYRKKIHIPKEVLKDLYWKKNLSTSEIAKKFNIKNRRTVHRKLVKYGIKTKSISQALTKKKKFLFSGNLSEKAYFFGLRTGDFYAKWVRKSIRIQTSTTHSAQINLLKNSFEKYGETRVYVTKNQNKEWFIYTDLHPSFNFLLLKLDEIPIWILNDNNNFYNFLAAYSDCEASFNIIKSHKNNVRIVFKIRSGDKKILEQIKLKLESKNYNPKFYLDIVKGTKTVYGETRKDIYNLTLYKKEDVLLLVNKLLPLSKHSEKIKKMKFILDNNDKNWDEISIMLSELKNEIKKELIKNQL